METKKGIGACSGIAIAKVLIYKEEPLDIVQISTDTPEQEIIRLDKAVAEAKQQLESITEQARVKMGEDKAAIFEAHMMLLEDPEMLNEVKKMITSQSIEAEFALLTVRSNYEAIFLSMDNDYMRERATDVVDVTDRILRILSGKQKADITSLKEETIIVTKDLAPSDTATMDRQNVVGFVTDMGGRTSHTAIMARTLEIPAIVGLGDISSVVAEGDLFIVDGSQGTILINPDEKTLLEYQEKQRIERVEKEELKTLISAPSVTKDGHHVELAANIGTPKDVAGVLANGGDAIGLYRTEFLYMDSPELPTEEEQFKAYQAVVQGMGGKPVIIRTLDIGGDKELEALPLPKEMNPFLGYRAIRICLEDVELFKTQLRALLRASAFGKLRIMFPMISSVEEVRRAKEILEEAKAELVVKGIAFDANIEVGIMIEVPSAAVIADLLAKEVDFFSIGTNDLIQYTTAVDRMNEKIAHLYNPLHPGILRLVHNVIQAAHKEGKFVGMCGEMAGDPKYIPVLLGLGLDEFSMSAPSILPARKLLSGLSFEKAQEMAQAVLEMSTSEEIQVYLDKTMNQ